jgi:type I restriction enzyme M protein
VLFLKYFDDLERARATAAELMGKSYSTIIDPEYRWNVWAAPKIKVNRAGTERVEVDHNALTGG